MKIGLIDVDSHRYPNLALMKLSAWHKAQGDTVDWWWNFDHYDRVYMSKVFDATYTNDMDDPLNTDELIKGGTGYDLNTKLPEEAEHIYPDYDLYPQYTHDKAYGFLSRGCPRRCPFCIVGKKEGCQSRKTADLSEWWRGQSEIILMDPNLLACPDRKELLWQLADSGARVDINQGLDCRLLNEELVFLLNQIRIKTVHFAWDSMTDSDAVLRGLQLYKRLAARRPHGRYGTVYTLVNFDTSLEEDLYRIYTLRSMGYHPYVMIYDKPHAPKQIRHLQRWCNNRRIFASVPDFRNFDPKQG